MASFNNTNQVKNRPKSDNTIEELDSVGDVEQMYEKYLFPIDRFRSISSSQNFANNSNTGNEAYNIITDPSNFMESRVSAFYRMIGLPVATNKGFYNPGHDPNQRKTKESRDKIDKSFENQPFQRILLARELNTKQRESIFRKKDENSSICATLLYLKNNFLFAKPDLGPFEPDTQIQTNNQRIEYINTLDIDDSLKKSIKEKFASQTHILKPFICDPSIVRAVQDESKTICVPFLANKQETSDGKNYLKRPIIEYVIRQRLEVSNVKEEKENLNRIISSLNLNDISISDDDSIFNFKNQIDSKNINSKALSTILIYSKAIKKCVLQLYESINEFSKLRAETKLYPLPSERGPEFGGTILTKTSAEEASAKVRANQILKLKETLSKLSNPISDDEISDNSSFAAAEVFDLSKNNSKQIDDTTKRLSEKGDKMNYHLKIIEIVTGEVSGLGLIDVLALYTTLWSIDLQFLIGLLDNNSIIRLSNVNNGNYSEIGPVALQLSGVRPSIEDCLAEFERVFFNILTFADNVYSEIAKNPINQNRSKQGSI